MGKHLLQKGSSKSLSCTGATNRERETWKKMSHLTGGAPGVSMFLRPTRGKGHLTGVDRKSVV